MDLKNLTTFIAVARSKNFSAAARELHTVQPTVSRHISDLEDELQTKLFERTTHQVELTPSGERLLPEALNIIENDQRIKSLIKQWDASKESEIRIGYLATASAFFLPDLITEFNDTHSNIRVRLHEMTAAELTDALVDNKVDIILSRESPHLDSEYFCSHLVYEDRLAALLSVKHPFTSLARVEIGQLQSEELYLFHRNDWHKVYESIIRTFKDHGLTPNVIGNPSNMRHLVTMVSSGLGISIIPQCIKFIAGEYCVCKPVPQLDIRLPLKLYYHKYSKNDHIADFIALIKQHSERIQAWLDQ